MQNLVASSGEEVDYKLLKLCVRVSSMQENYRGQQWRLQCLSLEWLVCPFQATVETIWRSLWKRSSLLMEEFSLQAFSKKALSDRNLFILIQTTTSFQIFTFLTGNLRPGPRSVSGFEANFLYVMTCGPKRLFAIDLHWERDICKSVSQPPRDDSFQCQDLIHLVP